ncbi:hypothetical protein QBC47DRAFT_388898 [Echria macrotheca]|uniref:Uncharacterized protein n=1 Tax=Echria macrotheca TaxID=438768 RepID=A0AAJ0F6P3_9PEZI|nr:hypothetical protein QBC47DRAFT_388898 [Echria macrotheca]
MNDDDASPPNNLRPRRAARQSEPFDRERTASSALERADAGSNAMSTDSTFTPRTSESLEPAPRISSPPLHDEAQRRTKPHHRGHNKHRSSGAFLLSDPVGSSPDHNVAARTHSQRSRRDGVSQRQRRADDGASARDARAGPSHRSDPTPEHSRAAARVSTGSAVTKGESLAGETAVGSSPRTSMAPLDMDSAQIVKMALNLSESRRMASRRNVSQPIPPKLAPLPDAAAGGSLRQHLQQQRRVSRTISPKPDRSPRIGGPRVLSPLQSAFEPDGSYRYHFSQSTLARAQKAKEYLELMGQYRRVLDMLPPLKPTTVERTPSASPPGSPNGSVHVFRVPTHTDGVIGRPYNPLQYIRNRKVRARERKAIDGESQGFNDVVKVSEWVDDVSRWVATGQTQASGTPALPPFTSADIMALQGSPLAAGARSAASSKPKRPRVDWVIDPADMLADLYWLEQDDNKKLVEDRHWRRVFPQGDGMYRPLSNDSPGQRLLTPSSTHESPDNKVITEKVSTDTLPSKPEHEHEHILSTARDRAQQKLRALRSSHHRHTGSMHNRDFLRIHRGSISESSDTDNDKRRRARNGTISSSGKDLLAKQMDDLIAQEQKSLGKQSQYDQEASRMKFTSPSLMTPDRETTRTSTVPTRSSSHRRDESRTDFSETEIKLPRLKPLPSSPQIQARDSLDIPRSGRRPSLDYDTSQPNSPDLRPLRDVALIPALGSDLSPMSSRPSSPTRNPLTRVKSIFRERSKERTNDIRIPIVEEDGTDYFSPPLERVESPDWKTESKGRSKSPPRKVGTGGTYGSHRSHRSVGSVKLRGEEGSGLRSLFRAPRIDSVLRSSVSKVSDMIWRRDSGGVDEQSSSTSSDSSDGEHGRRGRSRGRSKGSLLPSRTTSRRRHDSDTTSQLLSPGGQQSLSAPGSYPASRPISRRGSRFDLLKPPRIDVQNASPTASPPSEVAHPPPFDVSETESRKSSYTDALRTVDARLDAVLALPRLTQISPTTSSRHWSVADGVRVAFQPTISRSEIARLRALLLGFGIQAMEMDRRARERRILAFVQRSASPTAEAPGSPSSDAIPWSDIARLCPDPEVRERLVTQPVAKAELYPLAGGILSASMQDSAQQWQTASDKFKNETVPALWERVESLNEKVAGHLTPLVQTATEEADEANQDLVSEQRLKVKRVMDGMDKMLRRRRRRFRWVRRAGWLAVEWVLVGFMWYVWFIVMITRVLLGIGKGVGRAVRWLLWL